MTTRAQKVALLAEDLKGHYQLNERFNRGAASQIAVAAACYLIDKNALTSEVEKDYSIEMSIEGYWQSYEMG